MDVAIGVAPAVAPTSPAVSPGGGPTPDAAAFAALLASVAGDVVLEGGAMPEAVEAFEEPAADPRWASLAGALGGTGLAEARPAQVSLAVPLPAGRVLPGPPVLPPRELLRVGARLAEAAVGLAARPADARGAAAALAGAAPDAPEVARLAELLEQRIGPLPATGGQGTDPPETVTLSGEPAGAWAPVAAAEPALTPTTVPTVGPIAAPAAVAPAPAPVSAAAAPPPPPAPPARAVMDEADVMRQISDGLRLRTDARTQQAEIRLDPAELGEVRVRLEMQAGAVRMVLTTEHAAVRELVAANLDRLRQDLMAQGLHTTHVEVRQRTSGDGGRRDDRPDAESREGEGPAEAPPARRGGRSPVRASARGGSARIDVKA